MVSCCAACGCYAPKENTEQEIQHRRWKDQLTRVSAIVLAHEVSNMAQWQRMMSPSKVGAQHWNYLRIQKLTQPALADLAFVGILHPASEHEDEVGGEGLPILQSILSDVVDSDIENMRKNLQMFSNTGQTLDDQEKNRSQVLTDHIATLEKCTKNSLIGCLVC
jgi:hypothetical protein